MLGRHDNIKFYLFKDGDPALTEIPPLKDYEAGNKDVISRENEGKYFSYKKQGKVTFYREGYQYLREVNALDGVGADVRLIIREKNDRTSAQEYVTISNVGVDLFSLDFNDREQTCEADIVTGGLLEVIEKRWDDEIDIIPNTSLDGADIGPLATQQLLLTPRQIFRRSRLFLDTDQEFRVKVSGGGKTARGVPWLLDYRSEQEVVEVSTANIMNSVGGDYANLQFGQGPIILNAKLDTDYTLRGSVSLRNVFGIAGNSLTLDLVWFTGGQDLIYDRKQRLGTLDCSIAGAEVSYTFNDESVFVGAGESLAIAVLADFGLGSLIVLQANGELFIEQDSSYPQTYTRAMRIGDLFDRLLARITGKTGLFRSSCFASGGDWYDTLIAHGTWLRNMPDVINQGEDDEQKIQAKISLKNLYEAAHSILEPMRYKQVVEGLDQLFYVGPEKETQGNQVKVRIGQTRERFELATIFEPKRKVIGDNYFGKVQIGSTKTGNDYGEVNNLVSICGNATWLTVNDRSDSVYEALTEVRTGAEDAELQRSKQYADNPGVDAEYDEDWFLFDAKPVSGEFHLKKWADYYAAAPQNVYSADTNYNWGFTPARILERHAWKVATAWVPAKYITASLRFASSNCNASLVTQASGEDPLAEGENIPHARLERSTIYPMSVEFDYPVNQEIIEQLADPENLEGLVAFKTKDGVEYGRLVSVNTNNEGRWQFVQARLG